VSPATSGPAAPLIEGGTRGLVQGVVCPADMRDELVGKSHLVVVDVMGQAFGPAVHSVSHLC
jgi:hypothetical protein